MTADRPERPRRPDSACTELLVDLLPDLPGPDEDTLLPGDLASFRASACASDGTALGASGRPYGSGPRRPPRPASSPSARPRIRPSLLWLPTTKNAPRPIWSRSLNRDGGIEAPAAILARLAGKRVALREHVGPLRSNLAAARFAYLDPLNPMDRTAEVGMSNLVRNRRFSGIRVLNMVSPFAGFHTRCILQAHPPVSPTSPRVAGSDGANPALDRLSDPRVQVLDVGQALEQGLSVDHAGFRQGPAELRVPVQKVGHPTIDVSPNRHVDFNRPGGLLGELTRDAGVQSLASDHEQFVDTEHGACSTDGVLELRALTGVFLPALPPRRPGIPLRALRWEAPRRTGSRAGAPGPRAMDRSGPREAR
jgi:hypothetical protein